MSKVAIIGGGAAGMMAAIWVLRNNNNVTIYEKNEKVGKKIFITGKGRCNFTNACEERGDFSRHALLMHKETRGITYNSGSVDKYQK